MTYTTAALVGVAGGVGTTRTTLEAAVAAATDGADVAVLDAAYATQGLGDYLPGRIDPDLTALVTDRAEESLSVGLVDLDADVDGRVACCPVDAPFERLARAKHVEAARRFEGRIEEATATFDHVLLDVPPIAANQAVAAVNAADRVAIVAPASERGTEAVQRCHERLVDVGTEASLVVSVRGDLETADVSVPETDVTAADSVPACFDDEDAFAGAVGRLAAAVTGGEIADPEVERDGLLESVGGLVGR